MDNSLTVPVADKEFFALRPFQAVGIFVLFLVNGLRRFFLFLYDTQHALFMTRLRPKEIIHQYYSIGVQSAPVVLFAIGFAAAVTIIEYSYHMNLVLHSAALVPGFAALLILRELGAVLTALLLTSRVGAGIAAEVGTMQITEQIDALKLLNVDPYGYLVVPRFLACIFASMTLVIFANATCLFFSMLMSMNYLSFSPHSFLSAMNLFASFKDFYLGILKGAVFGAVIPLISCFYGFNTKAGAEGVGRATTNAVVTNAVTIIILDFILTFLFSYLY